MDTPAHALLSQWENFWVIVGSSAGGLTGLMFVVVALRLPRISSNGGSRSSYRSGDAQIPQSVGGDGALTRGERSIQHGDAHRSRRWYEVRLELEKEIVREQQRRRCEQQRCCDRQWLPHGPPGASHRTSCALAGGVTSLPTHESPT